MNVFSINRMKNAGAKAPANCEKASALSNQPHETSEEQRLLSRASLAVARQSSRKRDGKILI